jgi:hypothetical protein
LTVDVVAGRVRAGLSCPEAVGSAECTGEICDLPPGPTIRTAARTRVLSIVAQELLNTLAAGPLVLSGMLVDQHVVAILRNLDVRTRGEAGRLDLPGQDREWRLPT